MKCQVTKCTHEALYKPYCYYHFIQDHGYNVENPETIV